MLMKLGDRMLLTVVKARNRAMAGIAEQIIRGKVMVQIPLEME